MAKRRIVLIGVIVLVLLIAVPVILILTNLWQPQLRLGWAGTSLDNQLDYSYIRFNGEEVGTANVGANDVLVVDYRLTIDTGSLELRVVDSNGGVIWQRTFEGDIRSEAVIDVSTADRVQVQVVGNHTQGEFAVAWTVS